MISNGSLDENYFTHPWFRRGKVVTTLPWPLMKFTSFNVFGYTHQFFVVVYILLIVHGYYMYLSKEWHKKTAWMYIPVPIGSSSICMREIDPALGQ
ncbi:hypothetical protein N665_0692s0008 [Sinapis alba]|nr:hypothetical protein N665_0692s0008 [Sinapis alba]